jgi:hypothetical protein
LVAWTTSHPLPLLLLLLLLLSAAPGTCSRWR